MNNNSIHKYVLNKVNAFAAKSDFICRDFSSSYKIINEIYFCVRHKNRQKHNPYFKLLIFVKIYTLSYQAKYLHIEN